MAGFVFSGRIADPVCEDVFSLGRPQVPRPLACPVRSCDRPPGLGRRAAAASRQGRTAVIAGDTVGRERGRTLTSDAPETHGPRCGRGPVAGLKVKERLAQLVRVEAVSIDPGWAGALRPGARDPLRRRTGHRAVPIAEGLARPWRDGPEARAARIRPGCGP
jgi:hypothetical protein